MGATLSAADVIQYGCYKVYKFEHKWTIPNFKNLATKKPIGYSKSEYFHLKVEDKKHAFYLTLYPHGYNERVENYLSLYLKKPTETNEMLIQFTCALLDNGNKEIISKSIKQKLTIDSHSGWILFCRRDFVLDDDNSILVGDSLIFNCTLEIFENKAIMNAEIEEDEASLDESLSKMSADMNKLLLEGDFSDAFLRVDDQIFLVHKAILSARSTVFKAMMKSELLSSNEINISDINAEVVKELLLFIYTGTVSFTDVEETQELYYAADKYELNDLKHICYKILVNNLTVNNVIDILLLGHRHSDYQLTCASIRFMAKNMSDVQEKNEWVSLMKNFPQLANRVLKYHLNKSCSNKDGASSWYIFP